MDKDKRMNTDCAALEWIWLEMYSKSGVMFISGVHACHRSACRRCIQGHEFSVNVNETAVVTVDDPRMLETRTEHVRQEKVDSDHYM
jgi:hypothetical protein